MLENYYYDEFIAMLDAYNDMHRIDSDNESGKEYYAEEIQHFIQTKNILTKLLKNFVIYGKILINNYKI